LTAGRWFGKCVMRAYVEMLTTMLI